MQRVAQSRKGHEETVASLTTNSSAIMLEYAADIRHSVVDKLDNFFFIDANYN